MINLQLKRSIKYLILILIVTCFGCSSGKLVKSWKAPESSENIDRVLVIARSPNKEVRKSFEDAMVNHLKKQKTDAVSGLEQFPNLVERDSLTPQETQNIRDMIQAGGFRTVLLIALKDTRTTYVDNKPASNDNMLYDKGRYGISFVDYYNVHSIEYLSKDIRKYSNTEENPDMVTRTNASYNTYYVEALVYDLQRKSKDELIGVYEVEYVEPRSTEDLKKHFTKTISKQITK